jgi:hypothetical protein
VVVLIFFAKSRHYEVDVVVPSVYRNTFLTCALSILDYAANNAKDRKFHADRVSTQPIDVIHGEPHVLVPFAVEHDGRIGARALALLKALAIIALDKGMRSPFAYRAEGLSTHTLASLRVQR